MSKLSRRQHLKPDGNRMNSDSINTPLPITFNGEIN